MVAVIALLVGVLPVFADHPTAGVKPVPLDEGGGSGKCSVETGGLPSVAGNEFHINNPTLGMHSDGIITVDVRDLPEGRVFDVSVNEAFDVVVYDVIVNGGAKSLHYDYDSSVGGPVDDAEALHAPYKGNKLHNLSHINICYDVPGLTLFACGDDPVRLDSAGLFTAAEASIFANSVLGCTDDKGALFFIDNTDTEGADPTVTLAFQGDTGVKVAGRLDVTKEFAALPFVDLTYDRDGSGGSFVPVPWCDTRSFVVGEDGIQFSDWLTTGEGGSYPELPDEVETACKVAENEDISGTQVTVMYFELEDPQWR